MTDLLLALERLPPVALLRSSGLLYPVISALHIIGIALLVGAIAAFDLRLLGVIRGGDWRDSLRGNAPVAGAGLALALLTGLFLFAVRASVYVQNPALWVKWGLILLALLNIALFYRLLRGAAAQPTAGMRVCAALSLAFWVAAVFAGRWIAFTD